MAYYEIIIFLVLALDSSSWISIKMVLIWESNMGLQVRFNPAASVPNGACFQLGLIAFPREWGKGFRPFLASCSKVCRSL